MTTKTGFEHSFYAVILGVVSVSGCSPSASSDDHISSTDSSLSGCHGTASSSIPSDGVYDLTTFGGPGDGQQTSCGQSTQNGSWYYIADRSRFGCGTHVRITAGSSCVVAQVADYGPDVCVENAAGKPIIDASPKVAQALFGTSGAGWSDHLEVTVATVDSSEALGPCTTASTPTASDPTTTDPTASSTPDGGTADPGSSDPTPTAGQGCYSYTLGTDVDEGVCVQSVEDDSWYQCVDGNWDALSDDGTGPLGACTDTYPL